LLRSRLDLCLEPLLDLDLLFGLGDLVRLLLFLLSLERDLLRLLGDMLFRLDLYGEGDLLDGFGDSSLSSFAGIEPFLSNRGGDSEGLFFLDTDGLFLLSRLLRSLDLLLLRLRDLDLLRLLDLERLL